MVHHPRALIALAPLCILSLARPSVSAVTGFTPVAGYEADNLGLIADTFAVAPDGRFAVGRGSTITIYNHADPAGRAALAAVTDPGFRTLGGLAFQGADGLLITDNTAQAGAIYRADLTTGAVSTLAAPGTANDVAQIRVRPTDGAVFALEAHGPRNGAVVRVDAAGVTPFAGGLGTGYLGGLAFDSAGNLYVGDTNDPLFMGNAGKLLILNGVGMPIGSQSLMGGGGHGLYDVAGYNGDFYATTGNTLTRVIGQTASPFGTFSGAYAFPTDIAVDSSGVLVNGIFTDVGSVFRVRPATPVPEPATLALVAIGILPLVRLKRTTETQRHRECGMRK